MAVPIFGFHDQSIKIKHREACLSIILRMRSRAATEGRTSDDQAAE
jgi:hypothetical protein